MIFSRMFAARSSTGPALEELSPDRVKAMLEAGAVRLIDVREPAEYQAEHIEGAELFPLSRFDPHSLPRDEARPIVFTCRSGQRSAMAVSRCLSAGVPEFRHLKGGLMAWKHARLPTVARR